MQLIDIDKIRYRKHLNIVIVSFIALMLVLSLAFGSLLIYFFSNINTPVAVQVLEEVVEQTEVVSESNFKYNLLGVIFALLVSSAILQTLKTKNYFIEIYYVWQLKQLHNSIFRKLKSIKKGADSNDINAFIILNFYYHSLKQVYLLDDNTLTISTVDKNINELNETIKSKNLTINVEQFDKNLLVAYG